MKTRINMRANMDRFAPRTHDEFEKGDRVTVTDKGTGTVERTFANGDVYVLLDNGTPAVFLNWFVKRID